MGERDEARPAGNQTGQEHHRYQATGSVPGYADLDRRAHNRLRIAWLSVTADELYDVDPSGLLSAQLLDLRDLLEAMDAGRGWVA